MLPDSDVQASPRESNHSPLSARSGYSLRRIFHDEVGVPGRSASVHTTPNARRPPAESPRGRKPLLPDYASEPYSSPRSHLRVKSSETTCMSSSSCPM